MEKNSRTRGVADGVTSSTRGWVECQTGVGGWISHGLRQRADEKRARVVEFSQEKEPIKGGTGKNFGCIQGN